MKTYSNAISNYRAARNEYWEFKFLSFRVRDRATGAPQWFHFSTRDYDEIVQVRNQETGALEMRSYFGGGHVVSVDALIRSAGTGVRVLNMVLSGVSDPVRDMVYGYDCRGAVFELHIGEAEGPTGLLIDTPVCEFDGFIDSGDLDEAAIDMASETPATSAITLSANSHIAALQRTNPDMRALDIGKERGGDEIFKYADESNTWDIRWGKGPKKHKKNDNGDGRNRRTGQDPNQWR